jgi:hypothetical protein
MSLPELDPEQRRQALARATEVRQVRAQIKQMLKTGETTLAEVLDRASDDRLARMRVPELLEALPHVGPVRSRRLMERLDIAPTRRLGGLGPRQKAALLEELGS